MRKTMVLGLASAIGLGCFGAGAAQADAVEDFYRDKRIRIIAAAGAGGGFGLRARLLSEFIGRHMPGNPTAIAEFMPGAGGRKAADYIYTVAPKDGTAFGVLFDVTAALSVLRPEGTRYDPSKFNWLGSQSPTVVAMYVWHTAPGTNVDGLRRHETVFGSQAKGSTGYMLANAANTLGGTKFKIVMGYTGTADYLKAIEAGEIHSALADWDSVVSVRPQWVSSKTIIPVIQYTVKKHPSLPDVPRLLDLATTEEGRKIAEFQGVWAAIGHANAGPPGIPADRVAALRKAITTVYASPEFGKMAEKVQMAVTPVSAADLEKYVAQIMSFPPDLIAKARVAFGMD